MEKYTTKDVLLSTKDKLGEIEKKLNRLKELTCTKNDKNIKSIRYNISNNQHHDKKEPELTCNVSWNDKRLKGMIKNLQVHFNLYIWGRETGKVVRDNNGDSYILNDDYHMYIPNGNQEEFGAISEEILTDEFVRKFLDGFWFYPKGNASNQAMMVFPDRVEIRGLTNFANYITNFNYFPAEKTAKLKTIKGFELSEGILHELLNIPLDDSYFSDYRKKYIDSSAAKDKKIIITEFNINTGEVDFNVVEDDNEFYLVKK